jgi:hypothetical protein
VQSEKVANAPFTRSISAGVKSRAPWRLKTLFWSFMMLSPFVILDGVCGASAWSRIATREGALKDKRIISRPSAGIARSRKNCESLPKWNSRAFRCCSARKCSGPGRADLLPPRAQRAHDCGLAIHRERLLCSRQFTPWLRRQLSSINHRPGNPLAMEAGIAQHGL